MTDQPADPDQPRSKTPDVGPEDPTLQPDDPTIVSKDQTLSEDPTLDENAQVNADATVGTVDQTSMDSEVKTKSDAPVSDDDTDFSVAQGPTVRSPSRDTSANDKTIGESKSLTHQGKTVAGQTVSPDAATADSPDFTQKDQEIVGKRKSTLPERVSRYETISLLGEGSFGWVLKSNDPNLDRTVAVKIQKVSAMGSNQTVDRFLREARSAAQLRHPNIVPVFEYGKFADNHFIVYQFIEGKTLKEWFSQAERSVEAKVEMIARIAEALDYAHDSGIVHRDIKPANILVDGMGKPHIADFGCARREHGDVTHTIEGSLMGTPAYMSPEAASGQSHKADGRTDLWSVGVILYEMLGGQRPFRGKLTEIFHAIQYSPAKPLRQLDRTIPVELETICSKCLEKQPDDRFLTIGDFAADLRRWLDGVPIESRRTSVFRRTWMWAKRNQAVASLLGTVAIILIAATIGSLWFANDLRNKSRVIQRNQNEIVRSHIDSLRNADPTSLPLIIADVKDLDTAKAEQQIRNLMETNQSPVSAARYELALFRLNDDKDSNLVSSIANYLPSAAADELAVLVAELSASLADEEDDFWNIVHDLGQSPQRRLNASCVISQIPGSAENENDWSKVSLSIISFLSNENSRNLSILATMLRPVRKHLKDDLVGFFRNPRHDENTRERAAAILAELFVDATTVDERNQDVEFLCELVSNANPPAEPFQLRALFSGIDSQREHALDFLNRRLSEMADDDNVVFQRAINNVVMMIAMLDSGDQPATLSATPILDRPANGDPTQRTMFIHNASKSGIGASQFHELLSGYASMSEHRLIAVLAALGQYEQLQLDLSERYEMKDLLLEIFRKHPSAGVHSMSRWLLMTWDRQWTRPMRETFRKQFQDSLESIQTVDLPDFSGWQGTRPQVTWHEDKITHMCFAVFGPVVSFHMGPPETKSASTNISYQFGISTCEVTKGQFLNWWYNQFMPNVSGDEHKEFIDYYNAKSWPREEALAANANQPMVDVTWYEAARYCNALSEKANVKQEQWAYDQKQFLSDRRRVTRREYESNGLHATFRIPTATEWEYACRADTNTRYSFGRQYEFMNLYGWNVNNSNKQLHPVGMLIPNDFGMFDMHGNVTEWCHNIVSIEKPNSPEIRDLHYNEAPEDMTVFRPSMHTKGASLSDPRRGFRVARIYVPQ